MCLMIVLALFGSAEAVLNSGGRSSSPGTDGQVTASAKMEEAIDLQVTDYREHSLYDDSDDVGADNGMF